MNQFIRAIEVQIKCDICGEIMLPVYGCGFDNDRIVCSDKACTNKIKLVKNLSKEDIKVAVDEKNNSGYYNRGNCKSGKKPDGIVSNA